MWASLGRGAGTGGGDDDDEQRALRGAEAGNVETPAGLPGPRVTEVGDLPLWAGRWVTDAGDRVRAASFPIRKGAPSPYLDACGGGRHLLPSP